MWEAVLISQRPPPPARGRAQTWFLWVWPLTQAITWSWASSSASTASPRTRGDGSPPVADRGGLVIVSEVWWLNTITSRSVDAASTDLSQSNWVWSIEPSA